uniref:Uncharacterized protein n=1 Tax=Wuchereria bancrofti TaxID=6293 RepID=A0AAF5PUA9_WUCBA
MVDEKKQMKQISVKEKGTDLCRISDKKKHIKNGSFFRLKSLSHLISFLLLIFFW